MPDSPVKISLKVDRKPIPDVVLFCISLVIMMGIIFPNFLQDTVISEDFMILMTVVVWLLLELPLCKWLGDKKTVMVIFLEDSLILEYWNRNNTKIRRRAEIPYSRIKEVGKIMIIDRFHDEKGYYKVFIKQKQGWRKYLKYVLRSPEEEYEKHLDFDASSLASFYRECKQRGIKCC